MTEQRRFNAAGRSPVWQLSAKQLAAADFDVDFVNPRAIFVSLPGDVQILPWGSAESPDPITITVTQDQIDAADGYYEFKLCMAKRVIAAGTTKSGDDPSGVWGAWS